jgi:hypothetical protein
LLLCSVMSGTRYKEIKRTAPKVTTSPGRKDIPAAGRSQRAPAGIFPKQEFIRRVPAGSLCQS